MQYIKAVREDYYNNDRTERYEVGKEYKRFTYYFTTEEYIGRIPEVRAFERDKLLVTRFLQVDPTEPYDTGFGDFTSNHINIVREIPLEEIKDIFKKHGVYFWFEQAEKDALVNKSKRKKDLIKKIISLFRIRK